MSFDNYKLNTSENVETIRALISSRGRNGATLQELRDDFIRETGWPAYCISEFKLHQFLISIGDINMKRQDGFVYYTYNSPDSEHIVNLINRQRKIIKPTRRMSYQSSPMSIHSANSTINSVRFKRPLPMSTFPPSKKISLIEKRTSDYYKFTPIQSKKLSRMDENNNHYESSNNMNSSVISCVSDRWKEYDVNFNKFSPEFYGCPLVGDNFFLRLAVMEMGYKMTIDEDRYKSGSCVSGQTIHEATANLENFSENQVIIVNIGSIDIINGKELVDVILEIMRLLKLCQRKSIVPILTTLPPIAIYGLDDRAEVLNHYNEFLRQNPFNFPVIDLNRVFYNDNETLDCHCFQTQIRHMKGFSKPLVFWSRYGREKMMRCLTKSLGLSLMQIMQMRQFML